MRCFCIWWKGSKASSRTWVGQAARISSKIDVMVRWGCRGPWSSDISLAPSSWWADLQPKPWLDGSVSFARLTLVSSESLVRYNRRYKPRDNQCRSYTRVSELQYDHREDRRSLVRTISSASKPSSWVESRENRSSLTSMHSSNMFSIHWLRFWLPSIG